VAKNIEELKTFWTIFGGKCVNFRCSGGNCHSLSRLKGPLSFWRPRSGHYGPADYFCVARAIVVGPARAGMEEERGLARLPPLRGRIGGSLRSQKEKASGEEQVLGETLQGNRALKSGIFMRLTR